VRKGRCVGAHGGTPAALKSRYSTGPQPGQCVRRGPELQANSSTPPLGRLLKGRHPAPCACLVLVLAQKVRPFLFGLQLIEVFRPILRSRIGKTTIVETKRGIP
jgi:hypothetical protein